MLNFKKLFLTKSVKKSFYCSLTTTANGLLSFKKISRHREPPSFFSKLVAIVRAVFVFIGAERLVFAFIYSPVKKAKTCEISKLLSAIKIIADRTFPISSVLTVFFYFYLVNSKNSSMSFKMMSTAACQKSGFVR